MFQTVADVMDQIRPLVDDFEQSFTIDEYLLPFIRMAQSKLMKDVLENPELPALTSVVILPDIPAGTSTLASYQDSGQPLELMTGVISIKERLTDGLRSEADWVYLNPSRDIPTFSQGALNHYYAYNGTILLPGANQTLDLRIFAKFQPGKLVSGISPVAPNTADILAYYAAGLIATSRQNNQMASTYLTLGKESQQSMLANGIMELQGVRARLRSFSGRMDGFWRN